MKLSLFFSVFSLLVCAADPAPLALPPDIYVAPTLFSIEWESKEPFYGTGFAISKDDKYVFIATNAHVIPRLEKRNAIRVSGALTEQKRFPVTLVGLAPGKDLAILAVEQKGAIMESKEFKAMQLGIVKDPSQKFDFNKPFHLAVVGNAGERFFDRMDWADQTWEKEMGFLASWRGIEDVRFLLDSEVDLSTETALVEERTDCPPPFLKSCLRIPLRTQGFSGGLVLGARTDGPRYGMGQLFAMGLVSHYAPYTGDTYVIPMEEVDTVGQRLIAEGKAIGFEKPIWHLLDDTGTFEYVSTKRIRILKGPRAGKAVEAVSLLGLSSISPGGGDSVGGGGDSVGGGGDSVGGGGAGNPAATGLTDLRVDLVSIMGRGSYDRVSREMKLPELWGKAPLQLFSLLDLSQPFRGSSQLMGYWPGVRLESDDATYLNWEGTPVWTLQNFVTAYLGNGPKGRVPFDALPQELGMKAGTGFGQLSMAQIHRFKKWPQIDQETASYLVEEETEILKLANEKPVPSTPDVVQARSGLLPLAGISEASVKRRAGRVYVSAVTETFGAFDFNFPDQLEGTGNVHHEYRGPIVLESFKPLLPHAFPLAAYGVVIFQRDQTRAGHEIKFLFAIPGLTRPAPEKHLFAYDLWHYPYHEGEWAQVMGGFIPLTPGSVTVSAGPTEQSLMVDFWRFYEKSTELHASPEGKKMVDELKAYRKK